MKKVFVLLSVALTMFSCSDDDDSFEDKFAVSSSDLIGTWTLVDQSEGGSGESLDDCEKLSTLTFTETTMTTDAFFTNEEDVCELDDSSSINYTVSQNTITVTDDGGETEEGEITLISNESGTFVQRIFLIEDGVERQTNHRKVGE